MKVHTVTDAVHVTTIERDSKNSARDGGKAFLLEVFDLIHSNHQVGELRVQFGIGGSISSVQFTERQRIPQKDIEFEDESKQMSNGSGDYQKLPEKRLI